MPEYEVVWKIDIDADSPEDAARKSLEIQRDPDSIATVFQVTPSGASEPIRIDLNEIDVVNVPCRNCGRKDQPLHFNRLCPDCRNSWEGAILQGYLEAVLWADIHGDTDENFDIGDIAKECIQKARKEITAFVDQASSLFTDGEFSDPDQIGHDLHLTRNGYGSGFWDGDYKNGEALTEIAGQMKEVHVYVGDDNRVYIDSQFKGL